MITVCPKCNAIFKKGQTKCELCQGDTIPLGADIGLPKYKELMNNMEWKFRYWVETLIPYPETTPMERLVLSIARRGGDYLAAFRKMEKAKWYGRG